MSDWPSQKGFKHQSETMDNVLVSLVNLLFEVVFMSLCLFERSSEIMNLIHFSP
jgi:hypothetical protein